MDMELRLWFSISEHFGLYLKDGGKVSDLVKQADEIMLATERRDLMPNYQGMAWYLDGQVEPDPAAVRPIIPTKVEQLFLHLFHDLGGIG
jgi:hypothetical protein